MSESIHIEAGAPKEIQFEQLIPQIKALVGEERDEVAVLSNTAAALHQTFDHLWTGFYRVVHDQLVLGPFQGPVACMTIGFGKGVCGASWERAESIVVPDVDRFPGHIACSSESRSEIVVPVIGSSGEVKAILDIDSSVLNAFNDIDRRYLEQLCTYLGKVLY